MLDYEILELAKNCGFDSSIDENLTSGKIETFWECCEDQLLKFALAIHEDGYNKGYDRGCEDGYESAKVSTEMNTWSSDDD
jgi:hypothetical protein